MPDVIVLPFKTRRAKRRAAGATASVRLFPTRRQTGFVRCVVDELKALPTQKQRNERMVAVIREEFEYLSSLVEDVVAVEDDLIAFADEVWTQVTGVCRGGVA